MEKTKILHIILDLGAGGVENFLAELVIGMDRMKFDIYVLSLNAKKNSVIEHKMEEAGIRIRYLDTSTKYFDPGTMFLLSKIIREWQPDVVHIHTYVLKMAAYALWRNKVRHIVHTIHVPPEVEFRGCSKGAFLALYQKLGIVAAAVSKTVQESAVLVYRKKEVRLIYNGVDLHRFECRREYTRTGNEVRFLNISRFMQEKRHDVMIEAFARVVTEYPGVTFSFVGSGKLMEAAKQKVFECGLENNVMFHGAREDISDVLREHDVFVLGSDYEGFGLVLAEAMASGMPLITTEVGIVREWQKNKYGLVVPQNDPEAMAEAMLLMLRSSEMQQTCGEAGRTDATAYDLAVTIAQYEQLYQEILEVN